MKVSIRLPRGEWFFDDKKPLGKPGGFGEVFEGEDADGNVVAIKRLKVTAAEAAHRELTIAEELAGKSYENVLVPLDSGQDADTGAYLLVMPRAEKNLADELAVRGVLGPSERIDVLTQIALGLQEIPQLVHRDLKPPNILYHQGRWKIADFGIARFVEESTSVNTLKDCLTPPYAAPEQWKGEHTSGATDIYALCCIAYVLWTGQPPFRGPSPADYKQQHVSETPPTLNSADPRLGAIFYAGLRKAPSGRPSISRILNVLKDVLVNPSEGQSAIADLRAIDALEVERGLHVAAAAERERIASAERAVLVETAKTVLEGILGRLCQVVKENATAAGVGEGRVGREYLIALGDAQLQAAFGGAVRESFPVSKWEVLAIGGIEVTQSKPDTWHHGATLWYMRRDQNAEYRWCEVSYRRNPLYRGGALEGPFAIQDAGHDIYRLADVAAGPGMKPIEIEFGPLPIDDENVPHFIERWLSRLVQAYRGQLRPF
jgi:hypothetical protein